MERRLTMLVVSAFVTGCIGIPSDKSVSVGDTQPQVRAKRALAAACGRF